MNLLGYLLSAPNNVAFTIGRLTVQWYGLILTSAMVLGLVCIILLGKEQKIKSDDMITLFLYIIPLAVIFARLVYVIVRPEYFPIKSIGINHTIRVIMPSCCRCSMQFRAIRIYIIIRFPVTENSFQKFLVCTLYLQIFS